MFRFKIIENKDVWRDTLKHFSSADCYYSFEYGNLFATTEKGELFAAFYEDHETSIFYPFIKRRVPDIKDVLYDIVTPYGYGGPLINGINSNESITKFNDIFSSYCRLNNIITETIRFHPFYQNYKICENHWDVNYIRQTTAVDLTASLDEIRNKYTKMNKRNIKKAKKNNLSCFIAENNRENIKEFITLYRETMDRNNASSYYYFEEEYFFEQVKKTDTSETLLLFVKINDEIIAGAMVLVGKQFSHYHLGASKAKYLDLRPNNLLFDYMIDVCKSKDSKFLHLGGGYQENDGLFKFKTSFTNNNNYEYYLGKKVHNATLYNAIVNRIKREYDFNESYFPIYRAQLEKKKVLI